ncbi:DUF7344 domain-containing protein [Haloplanus sp. C73]|uniref:DUF7344 domain-containing protein n=1 Tax=Haloplanus sp. C73 TaxID=3421641 RepID=UPI003EBBD430
MSAQRGKSQGSGDETAIGGSDRRTPTEQEVFDVLSNRRRRYALYALLNDESTTIGSLSERVAAWENDCPVEDVTPSERKRVYTALQQSHLPKLERQGLIAFDPESGRVAATDTADEIDLYLEAVDDEQPPWTQFFLGLSALSVGILAAVWLNLPLFGSPRLWLTVVVGLFTASTLAYAYRASTLDAGDEPPDVRRYS